jgi:uncharacterized membrane protein
MYEYGHWHGFYGHMGVFFNIVLLLLVTFGILYAIPNSPKFPMEEGPEKRNSAMDSLKKRYASGKINAKEFASKKKDLES